MSKILLVEDHLDTLYSLSGLLALWGFTVVTATDGREGLRAAHAERPDLIVSDVAMPHLDGIEMVKLLRVEPEFESLPIIVYTAYGLEMRKKAILAGATRTLEKPIDPGSLVSIINELFDQRNEK